jgi:FKBP-type peptidyl-prolyl cis-trans isomerase
MYRSFAALALVAPAAAFSPPADVAAPPSAARHTPSGVAMTVLQPGKGKERPADNDCVKVHYTVWKRDGTFLSSSRQRGEPENQCLRAVFPGVAEALKSMTLGERRRVWVPAALTYTGDPDERPPQADVTFDLELLEIQRAPPTPVNLKKPPRSARRLPSGLAIEMLKKGDGTQHPTATSEVKLHFSGWTTDGHLVESSVMANHPAVFSMRGVIAGWREALFAMVVGDRARVWIPSALAYGPKPRRGQPKGDLVYELELLAIQ